MKKIINWFKKNSLIKSCMIIAVVSGAFEISIGKFVIGFSHLAIALIWHLVILQDKAIEDAFRLIDNYRKSEIGNLMRLTTQNDEKNYWISKYLLAKLKIDFCKRKISLSEFLEKLPKMEDTVRKNLDRLLEKQ